jgi:hypothetical protein
LERSRPARQGQHALPGAADEAFADLLRKHGRPVDLKTALRHSVGEIEKRPAAQRLEKIS